MRTIYFIGLVAVIASCSCRQNTHTKTAATTGTSKFAKGTFGYDRDFLQSHDSVVVLAEGNTRIIVSPKYQGKVFTSTADGDTGKSFGWINYKAFDGKPDAHMNAYGGEDRLWLGPEGGPFSLFFKPGTKMDFENWHTPAAIDNEPWEIVSMHGDKGIELLKNTQILNYANTLLKIKLERHIQIFKADAEGEIYGSYSADGKLKGVSYTTYNTITNTGDKAWDKITGAPCLWNLDMFPPSEETTIVIPYNTKAKGVVATTNYFGRIPPDRVRYSNGVLLFKADGKSRGKLGMPPVRSKGTLGSYDAESKVLTLVFFYADSKGTYLNQEWKTDKPPFIGDAANAYNDGPLATGGQMGPFYELESVSPVAFLKPGEKLTHQHTVYHFTGDEELLNRIAVNYLKISLKDIQAAFK